MQRAPMDDNDDDLRTVYVTIQPSALDQGASIRDLSRQLATDRAASSSDLNFDDVPWLDISSSTLDCSFLNDRLWESQGDVKKSLSKKKRGKSFSKKSVSTEPAVISKKKEAKLRVFKLLNTAAQNEEKLDSRELMKIMDDEPAVTRSKYLVFSFSEPVRVLHCLSALNAPLECIQKCYKANPAALRDASLSVGTPFHLACKGNVALRVTRYFASQDSDSLLVVNHAKRTPLHTAVACGTDSELIALLTEACPEAAEVEDINGCTPLDLAVSTKEPDIDVIEDLVSAHPPALGSGALHSAIRNKHLSTDILKMLVLKWPKALKSVDKDQNTPLHCAAQSGRSYKDIKVMAKKYPKSLHKVNAEDKTAFQVAKQLNLDEDIVDILRPNDGDLV